MKKSYLMIAAAAGLMLAACSQEDDFVAQNAAAQQGDGAVLFDTYLSNNSTRAGQTGAMTTSTLQQTGFGIIALTHDITDPVGGENPAYPFNGYAAGKPNFMYNQYVGYISSVWTYSPLKYWPNETNNDQQTSKASSDHQEGVSFFAYAPYVEHDASTAATTLSDGFKFKTPGTTGLIEITDNEEDQDPKVYYVIGAKPSESVDLLWGVSSGFSYHPVKTNSVATQPEGFPILNMMKPKLEERIKFDFKHALARIGMTVVGAFDQVAQGGSLDGATKVVIEKITVTGNFGTKGTLNLKNTVKDEALWEDITSASQSFAIDNSDGTEMNPQLIHNAADEEQFPTITGVTNNEQNVIAAKNAYLPYTGVPAYSSSAKYYTSAGVEIVAKYKSNTYYTKTGENYIKEVSSTPNVGATVYYTIVGGSGYPGDVEPSVADDIVFYTYDGSDYTKVGTKSEITWNNDSKTYYAITSTMVEKNATNCEYPDGSYYTQYLQPGYFMIIPDKTKVDSEGDLAVTVKIHYHVITKDEKHLAGADDAHKTSRIENEISQTVKLKKFTNGKAYNLKLILGLTSVKVDAEVSNWETGTVESNLPQNLE